MFCATQLAFGICTGLQDGIDGHDWVPFIGVKLLAVAGCANEGPEYSTNPCFLSGYQRRTGECFLTADR
jgi:hypothetical protein